MSRRRFHAAIALFLATLMEIFMGWPFPFGSGEEGFNEKRERMVRLQIAGRGIRDQRVLAAMAEVPRHLFVEEKYRDYAYHDGPLSIGHGQTISQPYIVALMTELLNIREGDKVLEVGTGSGYQAAVLSSLAEKVYTIELIKELGEEAAHRLSSLGYDNVEVKIGDGFYGWEEHAPYDAIMVTAALGYVPPPLLDQLKEGGKLCIPLGKPYEVQRLLLVTKMPGGKIVEREIIEVRFVPLKGGH